ncbi:MAG: LLM class flavin-dependent oxidoreductase [Actinomycetota bacterium]
MSVPRIGVQLPEVEREVRWPEYVAMARAAEEVGFDSIWVGDHLLYREGGGRPERGPWEAWTLLAGLAAATSRVHLGPLVACAGFHAPAMLAKLAATVDEVSGGRLVLGLGAGWNPGDFEAFGLPADERVARFEEAFDVIRRLLAGERVTSAGRFTRIADSVLLPRPARRVPLMVGSSGPRMLRATLPHVDAWNVWFDLFGNTPEGFAAENAKITAACEEVGRSPAAVERSTCVLVEVDPAAGERPRVVPPVTGSPEDVAAALRAFGEAGADEVILVVDPITEGSIRALGAALGVLRR